MLAIIRRQMKTYHLKNLFRHQRFIIFRGNSTLNHLFFFFFPQRMAFGILQNFSEGQTFTILASSIVQVLIEASVFLTYLKLLVFQFTFVPCVSGISQLTWVNRHKILCAGIIFFLSIFLSLWPVIATNTFYGLLDPLFLKSGCGLESLRKLCKCPRVQIPSSGFGFMHRYVLKAFCGF